MSESADSAMLEASGLKPTRTFEVYRIWWNAETRRADLGRGFSGW